MSWSDPDQLEEERRLFYVAVTRAREHLFLSYAQNTSEGDYIGFNRPSRYLREISANLYEQYIVERSEETSAEHDDESKD